MIHIEVLVARTPFHVEAQFETNARVSGLFGPSGSGKTTLLHAVAGLVRPERGRITVDDEVLFDSQRNIFLPPNRRGIGVVFQDGRLFPHLTVRENLAFAQPRPGAQGPGFDEVVHLLDLEAVLQSPAGAVSGGEARRTAIGRALLYRPRVILLDEPLTGLDADLRHRVLGYLLRLRDSLDLRMIYVSHAFADFLALVEEVAVIHAGRVLASGSPESVLETALGRTEEPVETTLAGTVEAVSGGMASVTCEGAVFTLPLPGAEPGSHVYVTVAAREILLAVGDPPQTSARNRLAGTVALVRHAGERVLVAVDAGPRFWVEVTGAAATELELAPGRPVHALIKATALRGVAFTT